MDRLYGLSPFVLALIVIGVAAVLGCIAYLRYRAAGKRREALAALALEMRWTFMPERDESLLSALSRFHLFSTGHSKRASNVLRGSTKYGDAAIFDYQYTKGAGQHRHTHRFTVMSLSFGGRSLPRFILRPERVWHRIGAVLGYQDINFDGAPEFSRKYLLRGDDEMEIRRLFREPLIAFWEKEHGLCMEGEGERLILYRERGQLRPEAIRPFLEKGLEVLSRLR
jgi:carbonic anhydrase